MNEAEDKTQAEDADTTDLRPGDGRHPWHWANEICPCGAKSLVKDRPASVKSDIPTFR